MPSDQASDWSMNIASQILKLEAEVRPSNDNEKAFQTLREVVDDCCAVIHKISDRPKTGWDQRYVLAVLKSIDTTLVNHGFVYPDEGGVDLLTDALTPFQMTEGRRRAFETQTHNARRVRMIAEKFPGPFFAADCDTASFLYLAVADRLKLPLCLVQIPSFNRHAGHTFIRWREGLHYIDWETMDGMAAPEGHFKQWRITAAEVEAKAALADLSRNEALGCEHLLLALQRERENENERALRELSLALELYPKCLDARREFAWLAATGAGISPRPGTAAIEHAQFLLQLVDDPDARDTLAAAYASAGMFEQAIKEERAALLHIERTPESKAGYGRRLQLYQRHIAYEQSVSRGPHSSSFEKSKRD